MLVSDDGKIFASKSKWKVTLKNVNPFSFNDRK